MKIYHLETFTGVIFTVIFIIVAIIILIGMFYKSYGTYGTYGTPEVSKCVKQNHEYLVDLWLQNKWDIKIKEMCELNQSYQICKQEREMAK